MRKSILFLFLLFSLPTHASIIVSGQFEARQSCQAYISKNKQTNPDQLTVAPRQSYTLLEINRPSPDWLRIEIPNQKNSLRWVEARCGRFEYQNNQISACDISVGKADSYVLALSWQPGFCETYGYEAGKPECLNLTAKSYASQHPTLHGLWPNQKACGTQYGFCGVAPKKSHCKYPPLGLSLEVANALKAFMPSFAYGSCLERHEWNKHGSCQILSSDDYFSLAMRLTQEADASAVGQFLRAHKGERISQEDLRESIRNAFGSAADEKIYLGCKNGMLVDMYFHLPALIPRQESLSELLSKSERLKRYNGCPKQIKISDFNNKRGLAY